MHIEYCFPIYCKLIDLNGYINALEKRPFKHKRLFEYMQCILWSLSSLKLLKQKQIILYFSEWNFSTWHRFFSLLSLLVWCGHNLKSEQVARNENIHVYVCTYVSWHGEQKDFGSPISLVVNEQRKKTANNSN